MSSEETIIDDEMRKAEEEAAKKAEEEEAAKKAEEEAAKKAEEITIQSRKRKRSSMGMMF